MRFEDSDVIYDLAPDLNRLATFALEASQAQSSLIFLPIEIFTGQTAEGKFSGLLQLGGYNSINNNLKERHKAKSGTGVIGWVSQNNKKVHISPFKNSYETLGFYSSEQTIGSVAAFPISLDFLQSDWQDDIISGVLYCDSSHKDKFNEYTLSLLEKIAKQASQIVGLSCRSNSSIANNLNFQDFYNRSTNLIDKLGRNSVEIMRIKLKNPNDTETHLGLSQFVLLFQKMQRLIQQVLPPQYPVIHLPNGETLAVVDNMMASFYENKIRIIAAHLSPENLNLDYQISRKTFNRYNKKISLEEMFTIEEEQEKTGKSFLGLKIAR